MLNPSQSKGRREENPMENNLNSPRVVAVDMDGTFVHSDNTYGQERFGRILKRVS